MRNATTRTGSLTPYDGDPTLVAVTIDPNDNMPTRASVDALLRHIGIAGDWHFDIGWDADQDDGRTILQIVDPARDDLIATLDLDPENRSHA